MNYFSPIGCWFRTNANSRKILFQCWKPCVLSNGMGVGARLFEFTRSSSKVRPGGRHEGSINTSRVKVKACKLDANATQGEGTKVRPTNRWTLEATIRRTTFGTHQSEEGFKNASPGGRHEGSLTFLSTARSLPDSTWNTLPTVKNQGFEQNLLQNVMKTL